MNASVDIQYNGMSLTVSGELTAETRGTFDTPGTSSTFDIAGVSDGEGELMEGFTEYELEEIVQLVYDELDGGEYQNIIESYENPDW